MSFARIATVVFAMMATVETLTPAARADGSDQAEAACQPSSPASPFETTAAGRCVTYSNTSLNGGGNTATVAPGSNVSISFDYVVDFTNCTNFCPGCIQQLYYGIRDEFSTCYTSNFQQNTSGSRNDAFTAPATPGYYYITQASSLQFSCVALNHNACEPAFALLIVDAVPPLTATAIGTDPSCSGCNDGEIDVTVSGGKAPYSFTWSNGETTEDLSGLPAGTYSVTVEDRCGACSVELTLTLDDDCSNFPCGKRGNKVQICHIPPGNPGNAHTICISPNAAPTHLANHGDHCGPCDE